MGKMYELGLLDCEDRPSIEENFARIKENFARIEESCDGPVLDENGKLLNAVLPEGYPYEEETTTRVLKGEGAYKFSEGQTTGSEWTAGITGALIRYQNVPIIVSIDGVDYHTTGTYVEEAEGIVAKLSGDYVEIGCIVTGDSGWLTASSPQSAKTVTVQIYTEEPQTVVQTIDPKFLPADIGGDIVLDENGKLLNEVLPEGYPYKERKFYYDNSGYQEGDELIMDSFFKVSDDVIPYEDIIGAEVDRNGEKTVIEKSRVQYVEGEYCLTVDFFVTYKDNVIVRFDGVELNFPTAGLYMYPNEFGNVSITKTTIVPMSEDFIPTNYIMQYILPNSFANKTELQEACHAIADGFYPFVTYQRGDNRPVTLSYDSCYEGGDGIHLYSLNGKKKYDLNVYNKTYPLDVLDALEEVTE